MRYETAATPSTSPRAAEPPKHSRPDSTLEPGRIDRSSADQGRGRGAVRRDPRGVRSPAPAPDGVRVLRREGGPRSRARVLDRKITRADEDFPHSATRLMIHAHRLPSGDPTGSLELHPTCSSRPDGTHPASPRPLPTLSSIVPPRAGSPEPDEAPRSDMGWTDEIEATHTETTAARGHDDFLRTRTPTCSA